ncbi:MAG: hypothetical protein JOY71_25120 [Acetobacteraceae bacterium]|nr:hypothetical protein [Acetobacteraceae bacterium]MBV8525364.1 hypothetical protein [Acetobacteraceae bacterium]
MKLILFATALGLPLIAGTAYADSEGYQGGASYPIVSSPARIDTGSSDYQLPSAMAVRETPNVVLRDAGSEATPVFSGMAASPNTVARR